MKLFSLLPLLLSSFIYASLPVELNQLPIRDNGRIKPFESFASGKLLQFSGKSTAYSFPNGKRTKAMDAVEWMTLLLFKPSAIESLQVFQINDPQIASSIGLSPVEYRSYSYAQIDANRFRLQELAKQAMAIDEEDQSGFQRNLISLSNSIDLYERFTRSMEFMKPSTAFQFPNEELRAKLLLAPERTQFSYLEIYRKAGLLAGTLDSLIFKKEVNWTGLDSASYQVSRQLFEWTQINDLPIPEMIPYFHDDKWWWLSPWSIISNMLLHDQVINSEITWLSQIRQGFLDNNDSLLSNAATQLRESINKRASNPEYRPDLLKAESLYNRVDPFIRAQVLFGIALLLALGGTLWKPRFLQNLSTGAILLASLLTTFGIGIRMFINQRPPVTTLFETFLFVALFCALLGLAIRFWKAPDVGNLLASISALCLLLISNKYAAEGDTLKVLVAVLDSDFWLSTHVVTITLRYAGVCASGVVGHIWLIQRIIGSKKEKLDSTYKALLGTLGFGLVLSFIGTLLGGVWADQSWGRFWGWDPKENGALLIVLWCSVLYHAKLAGWLGKGGMALGSMIGIIMTMFAWFGINLLGVGLHSYGFTNGVATAFYSYLAIQSVIILIGWIWLRKIGERVFLPVKK